MEQDAHQKSQKLIEPLGLSGVVSYWSNNQTVSTHE